MIGIAKKAAAVLAFVAAGFGAATTASAQERVSRVPANGVDRWTVTANAGDVVTVVVRGDGDTDLDLFVYDGNGRVVVSDQDYTDSCIVQFTVTRGGTFTVHVRNLGDVYNEYGISTTIR